MYACVYLSAVDFFVPQVFETHNMHKIHGEKLNRTTAFGYLHGRQQKPVMVNINMFETELNQKKNTEKKHTHTHRFAHRIAVASNGRRRSNSNNK